MNDFKTSSKEFLNANEMEKETNKIVSNFNRIQKGIESNTSALQKLQKTLIAYQKTLNNSDNIQISGLDKLKNIISITDTIENIANKFKNVGRGKMFPLIHCYCFENADINMCSLEY